MVLIYASEMYTVFSSYPMFAKLTVQLRKLSANKTIVINLNGFMLDLSNLNSQMTVMKT